MKRAISGLSGDLKIHVPFSEQGEVVASSKYGYDNARRGNEHFVIIQRTETGSGFFEWNGVRRTAGPGEAFVAIVPEKSSYGYSGCSEGRWVFSWLNFYGELGVALCRALRSRHGGVLKLVDGGEAVRGFYRLVAPEMRSGCPYERSVAAFRFLTDWTRELETPGLRNSDPVEELATALQHRFREPLSIKSLATELGLSREHLTRLFAERFSCGPSSYLRAIRIKEARTLMARTSLTASEIALRCGFPSRHALMRALSGNPTGD